MGDPAKVQSPPNHVRSMGRNAQDCARRILLHHEKLQKKKWNVLHEVNHECKTTSYTDMKLFLRIKKLEKGWHRHRDKHDNSTRECSRKCKKACRHSSPDTSSHLRQVKTDEIESKIYSNLNNEIISKPVNSYSLKILVIK